MPVSLILNSSSKAPRGETSQGEVPLWELLTRLLPRHAEWYTPADVARLFDLTSRAVLKHCRDLWPQWEGQYRLNGDEATRLIRRIVFAGRRVPSRAQIEKRLKERAR